MFQSTHLQEVRLGHVINVDFVKGFNPRTYKRCDYQPSVRVLAVMQFQSTHLQEVRRALSCTCTNAVLFQSTHLQEVRHQSLGLFLILMYSFNPRTYKRCDIVCESIVVTDGQFQSTHLQEVRLNILCFEMHTKWVSIHAPTRGATYVKQDI